MAEADRPFCRRSLLSDLSDACAGDVLRRPALSRRNRAAAAMVCAGDRALRPLRARVAFLDSAPLGKAALRNSRLCPAQAASRLTKTLRRDILGDGVRTGTF